MRRNWAVYAALLLLGISAIALADRAKFADINTSQKRNTTFIGPFDHENLYEQSFVSRSSNLCSIEFPIASFGYPRPYSFYIFMQLLDDDGNLVASRQYLVPHSSVVDTVRFSFAAQSDSLNKEYRLSLQTDSPPHVISLMGSEYDSYPEGELVFNRQRTESRDLSFFTYGKPGVFSILQKMIQNSGARLAGLIIISIIFGGLGHIVTYFIGAAQEPVEWFTHALLTGISLTPVIFFFFGLAKLRLVDFLVPIVILSLIISTLLALSTLWKKTHKHAAAQFQWKEIGILGVLLVLATLSRVVQIEDLVVPNGLDTAFHTNATERIRQSEGIPADSIYHLGFHANTVLVSEVTKISTPESILLYGQWLSIVSGLAFYLLARGFFADWRYAVVAVSFYWFISPIPSDLINIARYPFLQGFTLLPWAGILLWNNVQHKQRNGITLFLAFAGLFLSHYGSTAILLLFVTSYIIVEAAGGGFRGSRTSIVVKLLVAGGIVLLMGLIRLYFVITQGSWDSFLASDATIFTFNDYKDIFQHTLRSGGMLLWAFGSLGGILYVARYPQKLLLIFICLAGLLGSHWIQMSLLAHSATRPTNTLFALAIPLALLAGFCMQYFFSGRESAAVASALVLALAGAYNISGIVNPANVFYRHADQTAMKWIQANIPQEGVIVINSHPWDDYFGPADGGYWIPYMTDRQTVLANSHEEYGQIESFIQKTNADYVYIGSGYGNITPLLMARLDTELIYNANGIYIYQIHRTVDD